MPSALQLLDQLAFAAEHARFVSAGWHVILAAIAVAIAMRWRPSGRVAGLALAATCASVALVSARFGGPFNALVFGALAATFIALSMRDAAPVTPRRSIAGVAALALGVLYPHFSGWPVGVVPCATLYVIGGATLSGLAPRGAAFRWVVALAALFYGAIGVLVLRVWVDAGLVIVHAMCIRDAHAYSRAPHRARPRGLPDRSDFDAALVVGAKSDDDRADRSA